MGVGKHIDAYSTGSLVLARYCVYPASRVSLQMGKNKYEYPAMKKEENKSPKHNS